MYLKIPVCGREWMGKSHEETKGPGYPCLNPVSPLTFIWCLYADFIHPVRAYRSCNIVAASQN